MASKPDLRKLSKNRLEEAKILLKSGKYDGAKYLCGYAVEHALKLQICKNMNWDSYPPNNQGKEVFGDNLKSFKTHDPETLLLLSGKRKSVYNDSNALAAWDVLKEWDSEIRYEISPKTKIEVRTETKAMVNAAEKILRFLSLIT